MNEETATEFIALVTEMRTAQVQYFKTRDRALLLRSKQLEQRVDAMIEGVNQPDLLDSKP